VGEGEDFSALVSVAVSSDEDSGGADEEGLEVNVQGVEGVVVFSGWVCETAFDAEEAVCTLSGVALSPTQTVQ